MGTQANINAVLAFNRQLLSYQQTAEWGNHGLQGSFSCLRVPLDVSNVDWRADILETCLCEFCLCTHHVGFNQIRTVYLEQWAIDGEDP